MGALAYALGDPLTIVLAIVAGCLRDDKKAACVGAIGTVALVGFTALSWNSQFGPQPGMVEGVIGKAIGTAIWVAIGWGIGRAVWRARARKAALNQPAVPAGGGAAAANPVANPSLDSNLAQQVIVVRRALGLGQELRAQLADRLGLADPAVASLDQALARLEQVRAQLHETKQALSGAAAQTVATVAAEVEAAWCKENGRAA
jgi:hypothetical protein